MSSRVGDRRGGSTVAARANVAECHRGAQDACATCRQRDRRDAATRPSQGTRRRERARNADEIRRRRALERVADAARTESRVHQHGDRADTPARVQARGEIQSRRDEQRDAIALRDADVAQSRRDTVDVGVELGKRHRPPASAGHLDHREFVIAGAAVERRPRGRALGNRSDVVAPLVHARQPRVHGAGNVGVLGHEVVRADEAVHVGVRKPRVQVTQVQVGEHGIGRSPQQERRDVGECRNARHDALERRRARMRSGQRNVVDERADRSPTRRRTVRRVVRVAYRVRQRGPRQPQRGLDEARRAHADVLEHAGQACQPDQRGRRRARGLVHRRVRQHDARDVRAMLRDPAERDRPAPVVRDNHDWTTQVEPIGQRAEVVDALLQPAMSTSALGETHVELVDGNDAHPRVRTPKHRAPHVRPRGVAVHAEQRQRRIGDAVVEDVERTADTVQRGSGDQSRPRRVETLDRRRRK